MKWPVQILILGLLSSAGLVSWAAEAIDYGRIKGNALKEVLKPVPPKEPAEALRCLEVIAGFTVEFVAHEPLVFNPVAAAIDENGVMYVAEDIDYPYKPAAGELPKGKIRVLRDQDGDGFYEDSHLFAEGLLWPAGIAPWKGGVFVSAPPDIWYLKDTNADFKADLKEKVYTGFGMGGSQYILNNLQWGLDHRIYAAVAGNGDPFPFPGFSFSFYAYCSLLILNFSVVRLFAPGWLSVHRFLQRSGGKVTTYGKLSCKPREVDGKRNSRFLGQTVPKGTWCEFPD